MIRRYNQLRLRNARLLFQWLMEREAEQLVNYVVEERAAYRMDDNTGYLLNSNANRTFEILEQLIIN